MRDSLQIPIASNAWNVTFLSIPLFLFLLLVWDLIRAVNKAVTNGVLPRGTGQNTYICNYEHPFESIFELGSVYKLSGKIKGGKMWLHIELTKM